MGKRDLHLLAFMAVGGSENLGVQVVIRWA